MAAFISLVVLMGLGVIIQDDMMQIKEIEQAQENAPRKRRRMDYVDHHA